MHGNVFHSKRITKGMYYGRQRSGHVIEHTPLNAVIAVIPPVYGGNAAFYLYAVKYLPVICFRHNTQRYLRFSLFACQTPFFPVSAHEIIVIY